MATHLAPRSPKGYNVVMMKGAPEIVLTKCSAHLHNRQEKPIDEVGAVSGGWQGRGWGAGGARA